MSEMQITAIADSFYDILKSTPSEDTVLKLQRQASVFGSDASVEAFAWLATVLFAKLKNKENS